MGETATQTLGRGSLKVHERVMNVADVEVGMARDDVVRASPERLVALQPRSLLGAELFDLRVHPHSMP